MEFDTYLYKLQGTLFSLVKRKIPISLDNVEAIKVLQEAFQDIPQKEIELKMIYFMILNSDISAVNCLMDDENVSLFICVSPLLDHFKVVEIIYFLKLQLHLNTILKHCHSKITHDVLKAVICNSEIWKNHLFYNSLFELWYSVFYRIHYTSKGLVTDDSCEKLLIPLFEQMSFSIMEIIRSLCTSGITETTARNLHQFFNTILNIVRLYNNTGLTVEQNAIFNLSRNFEKSECKETGLNSQVCVQKIFNLLSEISLQVPVNLLQTVSNSYLENDSSCSIQRAVGEIIYYISEESKGVPIFGYNGFEEMKIKPKSFEETIAETNLDKVINNVEMGLKIWFKVLIYCKDNTNKYSDSTSISFISDKEAFDKNQKANAAQNFYAPCNTSILEKNAVVKCIINHIDMADNGDILFMLDQCLNILNEEKDLSFVKDLFLILLKYEPNKNYSKWVTKAFYEKPRAGYQFEKNSVELESEKLQDDFIEIFNKISNENLFDSYEIACLFLKSRKNTITQIIKLALMDSKQQKFCFNILKAFQNSYTRTVIDFKIENVHLPEMVILKFIVSKEFSEAEENSFISLFSKLMNIENFIGFHVFKEICTQLNLNLIEKNYRQALFLLKLLSLMISSTYFQNAQCVFLVYMAQTLEYLSWKWENFTIGQSEVKDYAVVLVFNLISRIKSGPLENVETQPCILDWAYEEISKSSCINRTLFFNYWFNMKKTCLKSMSLCSLFLILVNNDLGKDWSVFSSIANTFKFVEFDNNSKYSLVWLLITTLPLFTAQQWDHVYSSLKMLLENFKSEETALDILLSSFYFLSLRVNKNEEGYLCYLHCLRNFGRVIQSLDEVIGKFPIITLERIIFFLKEIKNNKLKEDSSLIISPVIIKLINKAKKEFGSSCQLKIKKLMKVLMVKKIEEAANRCLSFTECE